MQVAVAFGETRVRYKQRSYSQNIRVTELLVDIISVIGDKEGRVQLDERTRPIGSQAKLLPVAGDDLLPDGGPRA